MTVFIAAGILLSQAAMARDDIVNINAREALGSSDFLTTLGNDVAFYFAGEQSPPTERDFGEFVSNKKANGFARADEKACRRALLDALISFRDRARRQGANAVVGLVSYYKKDEVNKGAMIECHAGSLMSGVALKGKVVKLGGRGV